MSLEYCNFQENRWFVLFIVLQRFRECKVKWSVIFCKYPSKCKWVFYLPVWCLSMPPCHASRVVTVWHRGRLADEWASCIISQRTFKFERMDNWRNVKCLSPRLFASIFSSLGVASVNCLLSSKHKSARAEHIYLSSWFLLSTLRREIIKHGAHILQLQVILGETGAGDHETQ